MKNVLINSYRFNLKYAEELVTDVEENIMAVSPGKGLGNHPSFTPGHLISGSAMMSEELGGTSDINPEWGELFSRKEPGDPAVPEAGTRLYPS